MKLKKFLYILAVLPLTLFLDLILYAALQSCPSCGSFSVFLQTEGAMSFPLILSLENWYKNYFPK